MPIRAWSVGLEKSNEGQQVAYLCGVGNKSQLWRTSRTKDNEIGIRDVLRTSSGTLSV